MCVLYFVCCVCVCGCIDGMVCLQCLLKGVWSVVGLLSLSLLVSFGLSFVCAFLCACFCVAFE